ncbi:MAG: DUF485 domain-containing protein [Alphaproteobacteria bacterium]|nr:DUF485 domain-containing protein [Alphaproteobacteria bacterium]
MNTFQTFKFYKTKKRVSLFFSALLISTFVTFLIFAAFSKDIIVTQITPGLSVGIIWGVGVIVFAMILTLAYALWANAFQDKLSKFLLEAKKMPKAGKKRPVRG